MISFNLTGITYLMSNSVYITHLSSCFPNKAVNNEQMEGVLGMAGNRPSRGKRIVLRSNGITSRYYAIDPETGLATHTNAELTAESIKKLCDSEFDINDIDTLSCGTSIPDQVLPSHAVMVHGELSNRPCEVMSTAGVCLAGVSALKYGYLSVASGDTGTAVVTGSEVVSGLLRGSQFEAEVDHRVQELDERPDIAFEKDFLRWMLSDGAGAAVLRPAPRKEGLSLKIEWIYQKSYASELDVCMYSGAQKLDSGRLKGWQNFSPMDCAKESVFSIKQDVKLLSKNIVDYTIVRPLKDIMASKGLRACDVDHFLPHYSSEHFRQKAFDGLQCADFAIPYERWFTNLSDRGNTGSASMYIMLEELFRSDRLKVGQRILCYVPESGRFSTAFMLLTVC